MKEISGQTLARLMYFCLALGILLFVIAFSGIARGRTGEIYFLAAGLGLCILGATIWTSMKVSKLSQMTGAAVSLGLIVLSYAALSLDFVTEKIAVPILTLSALFFLVLLLSLTASLQREERSV
ncbi:MAG: hypothetical protein ACRD2L_03190 [Terriglobia bacterium]